MVRRKNGHRPMQPVRATRHHHHHHKHTGLGHLACSVSRVKVALSIVSLVSQLFSFLLGCKGMILKGFGFVAFFAGVKDSSFCIHLSCLVCSLSVDICMCIYIIKISRSVTLNLLAPEFYI
jgi:hypothetical protein